MGEQTCLFKNPNHLANLNNMRLSGQFCDVTIKVNDTEFRAHKNILAANLKYFQSVFNSHQESNQDVITMKDVEQAYLKAFIAFAYTGEIEITDMNALGLLKVANQLKEDTIKQTCIDFLKSNLKGKDACQAYQLANTIGCVALKNAAKSRIQSNFEYCSQTAVYFDFDCESLKKILCDIDLASESQQKLFEGVMRWILHDIKSRRVHINGLLNLIDITKLTADYLIEYFCQVMKDPGDITKEIMLLYHENMQEPKNVIVVGVADKKLQMQFYDRTEKKWCQSQVFTNWDEENFSTWTISNNKFYYIIYKGKSSPENSKDSLQALNLADKKDTVLASDNKLLSFSAMTACSRFIYLCGGWKSNGGYSAQVLRYNLQTNSLVELASMKTRRCRSTAIFYEGNLLVLGGHNESSIFNSVEKYDPDTKEWSAFPPMKNLRYYPGVAVLNGKLYACGGFDSNSVEVYDPSVNSWQLVVSMNKERSKFHVVVRDDKLLAIGGDDEMTIEVYDPSKNQWQIDREMSSGLQKGSILGAGLISSNFANRNFVYQNLV